MTTLLHHALADTTRANTHKAPKLFFTSLHTINDYTQVAAPSLPQRKPSNVDHHIPYLHNRKYLIVGKYNLKEKGVVHNHLTNELLLGTPL